VENELDCSSSTLTPLPSSVVELSVWAITPGGARLNADGVPRVRHQASNRKSTIRCSYDEVVMTRTAVAHLLDAQTIRHNYTITFLLFRW
jgi:hypothetical protein